MKTAVEFLIDRISEKQPNGFYVIDSLEDVKRIFDEARELHKRQIIMAAIYGLNSTVTGGYEADAAEYYYNETYGK